MLTIECEDHDFSDLAAAFDGEFEADCPLSLEIIFCDREEIKNLNAKFRSVDSVTDVLSFPTLDKIFQTNIKKAEHICDVAEDGSLFIGSIAICRDVAAAQAEEYGHSYERELYYLAAHGVCHLLGYDHMTDSDKAVMRTEEERVLSKLGLTRE